MLRLARLLAFALVLPSAVSATEEKPNEPFYWIVINNNRLITGDGEQDKFERQLCRAFDCSKTIPATAPTPWFCARLFKSSQYATDGVASGSLVKDKPYCDSSKPGGSKYWEPFPDGVSTSWNAADLKYGESTQYLRSNKRTLRAYRRDEKAGTPCHWKLEGVDAVVVTAPCYGDDANAAYHADIELNRTYTLSLTVGDDPKVYQRSVRVEDVLIAILGDSYASGEGNPHTFRNMSGGKDRKIETWLDRRCHRSLVGYPSMAVAIAAMQDRQLGKDLKHTFTSLNFSCSGAEIYGSGADGGGLLKPYVGREAKWQLETLDRYFPSIGEVNRDQALPSQIDQLKTNLCGKGQPFPCPGYEPPAFLVISIGGNDLGFGDIIRDFIKWCDDVDDKCAIDRVTERLEALAPAFNALAEQLKPLGVTGQIFLTEYPDLTHNEQGKPCDDFETNRTLGPATLEEVGWWLPFQGPLGVDRDEAERAFRTVLVPLNRFLAETARLHGWTIVSGAEHQSEFKGWCATPSWFVRFADSAYKQGFLPDPLRRRKISETLTTGIAHPNFFGHNWLNWEIRCHLEKTGILPPGSTQEGGKGRADACGARPR